MLQVRYFTAMEYWSVLKWSPYNKYSQNLCDHINQFRQTLLFANQRLDWALSPCEHHFADQLLVHWQLCAIGRETILAAQGTHEVNATNMDLNLS